MPGFWPGRGAGPQSTSGSESKAMPAHAVPALGTRPAKATFCHAADAGTAIVDDASVVFESRSSSAKTSDAPAGASTTA